MEGQSGRCKIVVVGDAECGKTALLQVFAKDAYPGVRNWRLERGAPRLRRVGDRGSGGSGNWCQGNQGREKEASRRSYVPTVFENYTASFEIDKRRIELNMWDTSGSPVPRGHPDWQGETQEFCPNAKVVLVGCKLDMRTDLATLRELSKQRLIPVTHEQGTVLAKQVGAVSYVECSSRSSERSVRDVFHVATVASLGRGHRQLRRTDSRRGLQRSTQLSGRPDRGNEGEIHKDRAKSCNLMDCEDRKGIESFHIPESEPWYKWQGETQEFCPNAKVVLVGCKLDMRTDLATLRELSKQRLIPVTHEQGTVLAKQVGAVSYVECSSRSSERSVRDVFHVATVASLGRGHRQLRRTDSRRGLQRSTQLSGRPDRGNEGEIHKDRAKSCNLM
ncbi:Rho-related GTP-binding protein RhoN [Microtus ochrogaster]|uniref:Rho-related GTP-binding protein RhoN n=2 Tax=Rodentia TaxID=9989 RepID=A0A8J6G716_MICOH|nr:Rho-related GTP-binding protein RhoN [Microtus ochrogaster]